MNEKNRRSILILDPERDVGELFARALETHKGFKCYLASKEEEAIELIKELHFGLLLLDMDIARAGGFSLLKRIRSLVPRAVIIIDAYLHQKDHFKEALSFGAHGFIFKPIKIDSLRKIVDQFYTA